MTRPIGNVERIRWIAALMASATLAMLMAFGLHQWQFRAVPDTSPTSPAPAGSSSPLDPRIARLAAGHPRQPIEAIVQFKAAISPERARWDASRFSGHVIADLHIINALAVRLPAERARWLAANPDVHAVSLNAIVKPEGGPREPGAGGPHNLVRTRDLQTTYDQTLAATGLWRDGFEGTGIGVAVIDTGIAGNLPDFQGPDGSRVVASAVVNPSARTAADGYGHGTDVAGIIAGNGNNLPASNPLKGDYVGVAPGANLISIKVSDEQGSGTVLDVIYGLQFAVDHQWEYNIRVVNMSLDSATPQSYTTDPLDAAAEAAWNHGIVVVTAAGNRGDDSDAVQYAPANDPYVITVGGANENGTAVPSDDSAANWSSRGTTQDGFHKPDVYAPGAHIVSVLAPQSVFAGACLACEVGGEYIRTSGTSMAAPMISGLVADLLQAHPFWSPSQVKGALTSSAVASNSLPEVDGTAVLGLTTPPRADVGLTPNQLINRLTGGIDYARSTWSRSTWSTATGALSATFARSSWTCACSALVPSVSNSSGVDSSRSTWSRSTWSTHFDPSSPTG